MTAIPNEDATVEAALKLCPFCGNAPVVRRSMQEYPAEGEHPAGEYEAWVTIACDTCGIEIGGEYRSEAIAAWNRRSAYPIIAGEGVRNDKRAAIANIVIDAVKHVRQRPAGLRGPYVFNDEELDRLIALSAPPPQPEDPPLPGAFITTNKCFDRYFISIEVKALSEMHAWHDAVLRLAWAK